MDTHGEERDWAAEPFFNHRRRIDRWRSGERLSSPAGPARASRRPSVAALVCFIEQQGAIGDAPAPKDRRAGRAEVAAFDRGGRNFPSWRPCKRRAAGGAELVPGRASRYTRTTAAMSSSSAFDAASRYGVRLFALALLWAGCSAGGAGSGTGVQPRGEGEGPVLPSAGSPGAPGLPSQGILIGDGSDAVDSNGNPINIGTELSCDGLDENQNGIIDDVDKGQDGLCDCLRIGFLGDFVSDAGNRTGAFEAWLEDRSDVPVTHIGARETLTPELLSELQVVVIGNMSQRAGGPAYAPAEVEALYRWVEAEAGGLMSLAGYTARETDIVPTMELLAPTGLGYDYMGRGPGVLGTGAPPVLTSGIVAPDHPALDGVAVMGVYNAYPVVGDGQVLIREGNFNLAMAKTVGLGNVFAFSDEWITQDALWGPMLERPLSPCQQACRQCEMQCSSCDQQCAACQQQPCQGGQLPPDGGTCARGCDQACDSCSGNCQACEQTCEACSALEPSTALDVPRFWLNVLRWLTPANECQVPVPLQIVF